MVDQSVDQMAGQLAVLKAGPKAFLMADSKAGQKVVQKAE